MTRLLPIILSIGLAGCGSGGGSQASLARPRPAVQFADLEATYLQLAPRGWVEDDHCDALLFTALTAVATDTPMELTAAEVEPGRWLRRPPAAGPCASDISRDQLLGVILYAWHFKDRDMLQRLWDWGEAHTWKMGKGDDRALMTPALVSLLARTLHALGAPSHRAAWVPVVVGSEPGYQSHLATLELWLLADLQGGLTSFQQGQLAAVQDSSPLAHALAWRFGLRDDLPSLAPWPTDRLPTSSDWCEEWRTQRAPDDANLAPCPAEGRTHTGGDLLWILKVLTTNR